LTQKQNAVSPVEKPRLFETGKDTNVKIEGENYAKLLFGYQLICSLHIYTYEAVNQALECFQQVLIENSQIFGSASGFCIMTLHILTQNFG
jgi:hypothetical protein